MDVYALQKENLPPSSVMSTAGTEKQKPTPVTFHISPTPNTSDLQQERMDLSESDEWSDVKDTEVCCVFERFPPERLNDRPHLKIVNLGQCDKCGHWVHLSFCPEKAVLRRGDTFIFPHC
ncbi:hypothetical protein DPMN_119129 [Dreissena polymorpha]|uniref:Uncharacterized protein n=1 Tax=Dreissena polymorpha TaxID=45954 RepID=A0A9D4GLX4_DREPO|nr:hypothetical protein DPMN_119129 [Dreissena polymorpha]